MRFLYTGFLLAFFSISSIGQDLDPEQYSILLEKFLVLDTSLNADDVRNLYFSYPGVSDFDPDEAVKSEIRIKNLSASGMHMDAVMVADSLLAIYPFSMVALFEKAYCCAFLGMEEEENSTSRLYRALIRSITSPYDGLSPETAFVIINQNDEFEIIRFFDLTAESYKEMTVSGKIFDVLYLKRNKPRIKEMYFDITIPVKLKERRMVEKLRDRN